MNDYEQGIADARRRHTITRDAHGIKHVHVPLMMMDGASTPARTSAPAHEPARQWDADDWQQYYDGKHDAEIEAAAADTTGRVAYEDRICNAWKSQHASPQQASAPLPATDSRPLGQSRYDQHLAKSRKAVSETWKHQN